jgi:hypothetical protein
VVITVPAPTGFSNINNVRILHFNDNGGYEVIRPVYENGSFTFAMTHFSDLAYAELTEEAADKDNANYYGVTAVTDGNGTVLVSKSATTKGVEYLEANENDTIYVTPVANNGYVVDSVSYYQVDAASDSMIKIVADNGTYSFTMPAYDVNVYATFRVRSSGGGGGGGSSTTTTDTTTTETTGKTEAVTGTNGVTGTVTTDANGNITAASVTVPASAITAANGNPVTLPVTVPAATSTANAPAITISVPKSAGTVKVEVPVTKVTSGCVAVLIGANGSETIVRNSTVSDNGVVVPVSGTVTVKIIDNSKSFGDVNSSNFFVDYIAFVTSRELFQGTSANTFNPNGSMTRQALMTVLARLDGQTANSVADGMAWAKAKGISDGSNPTASISRQQLATMLYRYAGQPATNGSLSSFSDANGVASYANAALAWAVENGIVTGTTDGKLNPEGTATRGQVAAMVARYVNAIG